MPKNPHANFSPVLDGYSGQEPFRFWCQMALPLTFDDSLSYYELLNKVVAYVNNTINDVATAEGNIEKLSEAYDELQKYVNDYFDDIDIEAELRTVLDGMAEDGSLDQLLDPIVAYRLPLVVGDQLGYVVSDQIGNVVADQLDNVVEEQLPGVAATQIPSEVTEWLGDNVTPVGSAVVVDSSLSVSGAAADAKVTGDEINYLRDATDALIAGLGFDPANNLLDLSSDALIPNTYIQTEGGVSPGETASNTQYTATNFIPVNANVLTLLTTGQTVTYRCAYYNKNKEYLADATFPSASAITNYYFGDHVIRTSEVPTGAKYIRISATNVFFTRTPGPALFEGTAQRAKTKYKAPHAKLDIETLDHRYLSALNSAVGGYVNNNGVKSYSLLNSTGNWQLGVVHSLKGPQRMFFTACFSVLGTLKFGLNGDSYILAVTADKYWFESGGVEPGDNNKYNHNLTIKDYIAVIIDLASDGAHMTGKIITNGGVKSISNTTFNTTFTGDRGRPTIIVSSTTRLSNAVAGWEPEVSRPIWAFGDSYFSAYSPSRWPYYIINWGYDKNILLNGYAGQSSATGIVDFKNLLEIGCPRYAVWCLGMNNPDTEDAIDSTWMSAVEEFLAVCDKYKIEPILSTIPNVPARTHTYKNTWVKDSGYRYVDFAAIVGATNAGSTWFDDMLETGGQRVHPTENGAIALATEFLAKVPEIAFKS